MNRTGSSRRRAVMAILIALALGSLWRIAAWTPIAPTGPGAPPDAGRREWRAFAPHQAAASTDRGASTEDAAEERLHVWLRSPTQTRSFRSVPRIAYLDVWPDRGDDRWDHAWFDGSSAVALMLQFGREGGKYRQGAKLLRFTDGEIEAPGSPEEAFVHLHLTWMAMEVARDQAFKAYTRRHLPEGASWESLPAAEREAIVAADPPPGFDPTAVIAAAEAIGARYPDHPVAEHARLAVFSSSLPRFEADVALGPDWIDRVEGFRDERLRARAALEIVDVGTFNPPDPELLSILLDLDASAPADGLRVAEWAARWCARREDWGCATRALSRLRATRSLHCAGRADDPWCVHTEALGRDLGARLAVLDGADPETWQEALTAEAWRCWLAGDPFEATLRSTATWDEGAWRVGPWEHETPFTACLSRVTATTPAPDRAIRVHLVVEGSP